MTHLLLNLTYDSLLNMGPPAAFQIDGNFGGSAAIAESLLSSSNGVIQILPALMPSSKQGAFKGFVAKGGFVVDAEWKDGALTKASIMSILGNALNVTVGTGQTISEATVGGESSGKGSIFFSKKLKTGETVNLVGGDSA
jgi:alpha-L-fucosidase 2